MASFLYWAGDAAAETPARRYIQLIEGGDAGAVRPDGRLLLARIFWERGDREETAVLVAAIEDHQRQAVAGARRAALLLPAVRVLLDMLNLALRGAAEREWLALADEAGKVSTGQEQIEILAVAGRSLAARGDAAAARRAFEL